MLPATLDQGWTGPVARGGLQPQLLREALRRKWRWLVLALSLGLGGDFLISLCPSAIWGKGLGSRWDHPGPGCGRAHLVSPSSPRKGQDTCLGNHRWEQAGPGFPLRAELSLPTC